jgi:catechol 2,3-dioxygenase-like lactoylglutathione lyase family enzyme
MAGIKHIEFWVSNLEQSISFYKKLFDLIGWEQYDPNGFRCEVTKIYFVEKEVSFNGNIGPRHICFEADSKEIIEKVSNLLKERNLDIIRGPIEYEYKGNTAYTIDFRDPDGYIIEVATKSHKQ